jgi:16S rRNA processing protein RimM
MRVVVGRIGRAQGIRGELTVEVRTDAPEERFSPGAVLVLSGRSGLPATATVAGHRWQNGRLILSIVGITDRTAAESLRGALLEAEVDLAPVGADPDEFHDLALVGLLVRDLEGVELGRISEVLHLPGQDVLSIARPGQPELLVPFVREMVPEVDVLGGVVVVDLPDGLADLGAS